MILLDKCNYVCYNMFIIRFMLNEIQKVFQINLKGIDFMKSTGIVRKVDELGRIVLPIELRRTYDLAVKDAIEIYTDDDKIILKKFQRTCIFCGSGEECVEYKGKTICAACMAELKGENK